MKYDIGLLKLNPESGEDSTLLPSQLKSLRIGQSIEYSFGDLSNWPPQLMGQRSSSIFWNFKADLLIQPMQIRKEHTNWSMLYRLATIKDGKSNISHSTNITPHQVSEEFLGLLCQTVKDRLEKIWGTHLNIKFYFTAPGYSKAEAETYRSNTRSILEKIHRKDFLKGVSFPQEAEASTEQFLFEQYGAYYYFSRCEQKIKPDQPSTNYLIIDVGGSTTDIAVIHLTKGGALSQRALPIHNSIQYGGSDLNQTIIKKVISSKHHSQLSENDWLDALQKVEEIKIKILDDPEKTSSIALKLSGPVSWQISYQKIVEAFEEDWESKIKPGILSTLQLAEAHDHFSSKEKGLCIDSILLAGGGSKSKIFRESLETDPSFAPYLSKNCHVYRAEVANPSSLAAVGLGISIAERRSDEFQAKAGQHGELSQAEKIYYRILKIIDINNTKGQALNLVRHRNDRELLMTMPEFSRMRVTRRKASHFDMPYTVFTTEHLSVLPEKLAIQFWTDCNSDVREFLIPLSKPSNIGTAQAKDLMFGATAYESSQKKDIDSTNIRIKPHFFQWLPDKKRPARCDRGEDSTKIDISLLPEAIKESDSENPIYVCIDFGMTNTSVAVLAPNHKLNDNDFQILSVQLPQAESKSPSFRKPAKLPKHVEKTEEVTTVSTTQLSKAIGISEKDSKEQNQAELPEPTGAENKSSLDTNGNPSNPDETQSSSNSAPPEDKFIPTEGIDRNIIDDESIVRLEQSLATLGREFKNYAQQTSNAIRLLAEIVQQTDKLQDSSNSLQEINPYNLLPSLIPADLEGENFSSFCDYVDQKGFRYDNTVLSAVWAQANNSNARLTVLAGPPGSGKTALVSLLAQYFNKDISQTDSFDRVYLLEPVLPSWFSSENLLGFYDQIQGKFRPTSFFRFVKDSQCHFNSQRSRKFFVCLDEFNLAQPEQYLSKILSTIESSTKRVIVCQDTREEIELTSNLKLFATINTDAASKTLSPKVLDRSMLIRVLPTKEGILSHAENLLAKMEHGKETFQAFKDELDNLFELGIVANSIFGYRTIDSVASYIKAYPFSSSASNLEGTTKFVLDSIISSFFLSKLPGLNQFGDYQKYLVKLEEAKDRFTQQELPVSLSILEKIICGFPGQSAF